jgi:flagellar basal body-associated protein FliL
MKKLNSKNQTSILYLLLILSILVVFLIFFLPYLKNTLPPFNFYKDLSVTYHLAINDTSSFISIFKGWDFLYSKPWFNFDCALWYLPTIIINFITSNPWLSIKITQILEVSVSFLGAFLLIKKYTKNIFIALLAGFLYSTTPHFLTNLVEAANLSWAYAILPFSLLLIELSFEKNKLPISILSGIVLSLATIYISPQYVFYFGIPLALFILLKIFPLSRKSLLTFSITFFSFLLTSSFFLTNSFLEHFPYSQFEEENIYRKNPLVTDFYTPSFFEIITFQNKEANISNGYAREPIVNLLPILIIIIGLFSLFQKNQERKKKITIFIIGVLAAILAIGNHGYIFLIFKKTLPYFFSIRTPGRFAPLFILSFIILASFTLEKIKTKKYLFGFALITFFLLSALSLNFYNKKIHVFENTTTEKISSLFPDQATITETIRNNAYRALDLSLSENSPHNLEYYSSEERTLLNPYDLVFKFKDLDLTKILGVLNIKYVLTPTETSQKKFDVNPIIERQNDFIELEKNPSVTLWENPEARPQKYLATPYIVYGGPKNLNSVLENEVYLFAEQPETQSSLPALEKNFYPVHLYSQTSILDLIYIQEILNKKGSDLNTKTFTTVDFTEKDSNWKIIKEHDYPKKLDFGFNFNSNFYNNSIFNDNLLSEEGALFSSDPGLAQLNFSPEQEGTYLIFLRLKTNPFNSPKISLDGRPAKIQLQNSGDFQWVALEYQELDNTSFQKKIHLDKSKKYTLNITNPEKEPLYIDQVLIIKEDYFQKTRENVLNDKKSETNSQYVIYSQNPSAFFNLLDTENYNLETGLSQNSFQEFTKDSLEKEEIKFNFEATEAISKAQLNFQGSLQGILLKIYLNDNLEKTLEITDQKNIAEKIDLIPSSLSTHGKLTLEILKNPNIPDNSSSLTIRELTLTLETSPFKNTEKENFVTFSPEIFTSGSYTFEFNEDFPDNLKKEFFEKTLINNEKISHFYNSDTPDNFNLQNPTLKLESGIYTLNIPETLLKDTRLQKIILKNTHTTPSQPILVFLELYSPNWKIKSGQESLTAFPANIFTNGFLTSKLEDTPFYSRNLLSKISLFLSLVPLFVLFVLTMITLCQKFKKPFRKS